MGLEFESKFVWLQNLCAYPITLHTYRVDKNLAPWEPRKRKNVEWLLKILNYIYKKKS